MDNTASNYPEYYKLGVKIGRSGKTDLADDFAEIDSKKENDKSNVKTIYDSTISDVQEMLDKIKDEVANLRNTVETQENTLKEDIKQKILSSWDFIVDKETSHIKFMRYISSIIFVLVGIIALFGGGIFIHEIFFGKTNIVEILSDLNYIFCIGTFAIFSFLICYFLTPILKDNDQIKKGEFGFKLISFYIILVLASLFIYVLIAQFVYNQSNIESNKKILSFIFIFISLPAFIPINVGIELFRVHLLDSFRISKNKRLRKYFLPILDCSNLLESKIDLFVKKIDSLNTSNEQDILKIEREYSQKKESLQLGFMFGKSLKERMDDLNNNQNQ